MKRLYLTAVCLILLSIPVDAGPLPRLRRSPSRDSSVIRRNVLLAIIVLFSGYTFIGRVRTNEKWCGYAFHASRSV